jgi:hypothetical protein
MPKVLNKYFETNDPETLILEITLIDGNSFDILFDKEDFNLVSDYHWSLSSDKKYARSTMDLKHNRKQVRLHRLLLPNAKIIDHKDRNTFNCKKSNLEETTYLKNNRNKSKCKRNKSGRTGVYLRNKNNNLFWVAEWADNKKKFQKWFSINKYGDTEAFNLACLTRLNAEKSLNILNEK